MKSIYGSVVIAWLVLQQMTATRTDKTGIALLLGMLCLFIVKERFLNRTWSAYVFWAIVLALSLFNVTFIPLLAIPIVDFLYFRRFVYGAAAIAVGLIVSVMIGNELSPLILLLSALFGYAVGEKEGNERQHVLVLDDERRLRYRLERTTNELIQSRKEIEHLTRIKERNRIAHEIHDNVGHRIAGVIFQLEAARRIRDKDSRKLADILQLCSAKLSEALELTRRTVHNINTSKKIGPELLGKIIDEFKYCPIDFAYNGSFDVVSASNMEILEKMTMESLTNAAKHSMADHIQVAIDIRSKNIRFYYKDNGVGCSNSYEGLGISGMRKRVREAGGTIAVDGQDGFMIVCHLPIGAEQKGEE